MSLLTMREAIDRVDAELLALLARRGRLVKKVGAFKRKKRLPLKQPGREREVLRRVVARNGGPYPDAAVRRVWTRILRESLALERAAK